MIKSNKGSTILITPIVWVITIFIFIFFIVFGIRIIEPFMIYQKISSTALKYIFVMEEFGYLNKSDEKSLKNELINKGLKNENIFINATNQLKDYGEVIELTVKYNHQYREIRFDNSLIPRYNEELMEICVSKKGVSKR